MAKTAVAVKDNKSAVKDSSAPNSPGAETPDSNYGSDFFDRLSVLTSSSSKSSLSSTSSSKSSSPTSPMIITRSKAKIIRGGGGKA